MRIDGNGGSQPLVEVASGASQTAASLNGQTPSQTVDAGVLAEDQADLSGSHTEVQALTAQALQFPEIREDKVNTLRQVVENGSYRFSSGQIADAMLADVVVLPAA